MLYKEPDVVDQGVVMQEFVYSPFALCETLRFVQSNSTYPRAKCPVVNWYAQTLTLLEFY